MTEQEKEKMKQDLVKELFKSLNIMMKESSFRVRKMKKMVKRGNLKYIIWKLKNKTI